MQVQNRVAQAVPRLPEAVRQLGVTTVKSSPNITMVVHLVSKDGRYDGLYLNNFANLRVRDELARLQGVGQALAFGAGTYAMRVWIDPDKVAARDLTATDVINAIREQNVQVSAGTIGGPPHPDSPMQFSINAQGRLDSPEQFGDIVLKSGANGEITRLADVARVELGANAYTINSLLNNKEAAAIVIFEAPGANTIELSNAVRAKMSELEKGFPEGVEWEVAYDPTVFVRQSIDSVVTTLLEAVALVVLVVADGTIDIVVGTHKLLSKDVKFERLGLLIIDEEHRFGVRHKEAMKAMRAEIDVLTLTATPIPRTLGMALEGLRDMSVIATAPQRRLAIKTFVRTESNGVIREAVLRELKRGGQVYFLHNEVDTIQNRKERLEEILPEARIAIAHGQMPERELERVMRDFVAQRYNLLLCSTIIETGIDVPTANTIVMARADKFGLAQLHQLRGRVGRSHHQAYAYLMVPDVEGLTKQAGQRLEAIQQMEELGSGFYLAMHDLEIRGTGEVLGENQSGNMMEIGFQLYNEMLSEAVRCLKAGIEPDLMAPTNVTTEINLHSPALLPDDYCGDVHLRLSFYKKLATAKTTDQIDTLLEEIVDRFGKLPHQAQTLLDVHRLRVLAKDYGVVKVDAAPGVINISFKPNPPVDPMSIIQLIQKNRHIKLTGNDKLRIERDLPEAKDRALMVRDVLRNLVLVKMHP